MLYVTCDANVLNITNDESTMASGNPPLKKLGFGLVGSGQKGQVLH